MAEKPEIRKAAMELLDRQSMSRSRLVKKLTDRGYEPELVERTADWLTEIGALNDDLYAADIARHYVRKGFGPQRIRAELQKRGVDRETASEAVEELEPSRDAIDRFIQSRLKGREPDRQELNRIIGALRRRGHGWEEIHSALGRYQNMMEDEGFDESC